MYAQYSDMYCDRHFFNKNIAWYDKCARQMSFWTEMGGIVLHITDHWAAS